MQEGGNAMGDLIDFINRHVWVLIVFFAVLFGATYAITRILPVDRTKREAPRKEAEQPDASKEVKEEGGQDDIPAIEDDKKTGQTPDPTPIPQEKGVIYQDTASDKKIVMRFGGDINLADNYAVMKYADTQDNGITDCFGKNLRALMADADVMLLNHEYACSNTGTAMPGKAYTFLAKEKNNKELKKLGVDIVSLANNHTYDYGKEAFLNTRKNLKKLGISYVGGGKNAKEAASPVYYNMNGVKIAIVAATRAEKNIMTPEAKKNSPGVMYTYDSAAFLNVIKKAKKNSDYVIAYVHWGTEHSTTLETAQTTQAHEYIDSGADLVIGSHTHCLQGMEYYKGKPVVYSLGNYLFNDETQDTGLLELRIDTKNREEVPVDEKGRKASYEGVKNKDVTVKFYPCIQTGCRTTLTPDEAQNQRILQEVTDISVNARLTKQGILKKNK